MSRLCAIGVAILLLCSARPVLSAADEQPAAQRKPNFVIIMADDLGYGDISTFGGWIATPNLDRLAREGMRLTDYHSNGAVCSPTRAALVTGRYQQRAGIPAVIVANPKAEVHDHGLQTQEVSFAELLRQAGYATAIFGKWHLGYHPKYNPIHQGFDVFRGYVSGNVDYFSHIDQAGNFDWWQQDQKRDEPGYTTHLITRHGVRYIEAHCNEPFCLYLAHEAPHYPYQGPDDEPFRAEGRPRGPGQSNEQVKEAYRQMVQEVDRGVGQVVETLKRLGLERNTLVFFCSDNGAWRTGNNLPLRGWKGTLWEGGHRVPAVAWWPGRIKPGQVNDSLCASMDLMPTMLSLAGVQPPEDRPLDGVDLSPVLFEGKRLTEREMFWSFGPAGAMRDGPWKLVVHKAKGDRPQVELFNLADDLGEKHNLAEQQPDRTQRMLGQYRAWLDEVTRTATPQPTRHQEPAP